MIENPNSKIDKLKTIPPERLIQMYRNVFNGGDGELVLEDLRGRFWKYTPPIGDARHNTEFKVGQQSVITHIENMINQPEGVQDDQQQS